MKKTLRPLLAAAAATYGLLLLDWHPAGPPSAPVVRESFQATAPLEAGAASVGLAPPLPVVRAGYALPRPKATRERDPLQARAIVVRGGGRSLAIVLLDLVLVPDALSRGLEARLSDLRFDGVLLLATHTHSSVGGFDERLLAQVLGTGRYRPDVVAAILGAGERAVREAAARAVPARVRTAEDRMAGWAANRSTPDAPIDDALHVVVLEGEAGAPIATLAVVAAHPTLEARTNPELSADYPGAAMRRLEQAGGVALLLQGAEGDAAVPGRGVEAIEAAGSAVADRVARAARAAAPAASRLGFVRAQIDLPPAEVQAMRPFLVRRPLSNVVRGLLPRRANVEVVTLGDVILLAVPGEPTALAARDWLPGSERKARVVALADGYVGYIDTPERVRDGTGEAPRAWFEAGLADAIGQGLQVAHGDRR